MRKPSETVCFGCGSVIERGIPSCPYCGGRIATGPQTVVHAAPRDFGAPASTMAAEDVVGAGRYILNFILAGIVGLILSYLLRNHGWLATWICIPIFLLVVVLFAFAYDPGAAG